jgi:hypothetical protein
MQRLEVTTHGRVLCGACFDVQLDWNKGRIDVVQRLDLLKQIRLLERDLQRLSPQHDN